MKYPGICLSYICFLLVPLRGRGDIVMTGTRRSRYRTEHIPGYFITFCQKKKKKKKTRSKKREIEGKKAEKSGKTRDGGEKQP